MKLWLLSQNENNGYDTYDSCVVAAETESDAVRIHPYSRWLQEGDGLLWEDEFPTWAKTPQTVKAKYIGEAAEGITAGEVICASFNAG